MRPVIASPLVAIAICACSESLAPSAYVGSYPLRTVNGAAIPAAVPAQPDSCTMAFGGGNLTLRDGVFSMTLNAGVGCPGVNGAAYVVTVGGSLEGSSFPMSARAIDPTDPKASTMDMVLSVSGSDATLTLPPGAMNVASTTTLGFGPRQ